ncbi:MAG: hypothetical protein M1834_007520 [Cirrosporium novae-zelandiae]|nr:MAG: hypothetical protein M1834_007520 [Cirrosporium novae-zelandiae]
MGKRLMPTMYSRLEEVESQLLEIQQTIGTHDHNNELDSESRSQIAGNASDSAAIRSLLGPQSTEAQPTFGLDNAILDGPQIQPASLGGIELSSVSITKLFDHRYHPSESHIFSELITPYQELLSKFLIKSPLSLFSIQAILFICTWPLPVRYQACDPSWSYCGLAINAALQQGLDSDHNSTEASNLSPRDLNIRTRTWLGCFFVSTIWSVNMGLPPLLRTLSDLNKIASLVRDPSIPNELAMQIEIQYSVARYTTILIDSQDLLIRNPLIQLFDQELDDLRHKFSDTWDKRAEYNLLAAKLNLYTLACVREARRSDKTALQLNGNYFMEPTLQITRYSGLASAVRIIALFPEFLKESDLPSNNSGKPQNLSCHPKSFFRSLLFATFFLLTYFAFNSTVHESEKDLARNHIRLAYDSLVSCSIDPLDESGRAAKVIEVLAGHPSSNCKTVELKIRSRLGASIVYDGIRRAREIRQSASNVIRENDIQAQPSASTLTEDNIALTSAFDKSDTLFIPQTADTEGIDIWLSNAGLSGGALDDLDMEFLESLSDFTANGPTL